MPSAVKWDVVVWNEHDGVGPCYARYPWFDEVGYGLGFCWFVLQSFDKATSITRPPTMVSTSASAHWRRQQTKQLIMLVDGHDVG